jgi:DNA-binding IclR family transcriptional regulator
MQPGKRATVSTGRLFSGQALRAVSLRETVHAELEALAEETAETATLECSPKEV